MSLAAVSTHDENASGAPWWLVAIYRLGVPAAIALFLVWFVTKDLRGEVIAMHTEVTNHSVAMNRELERTRELLFAICVISAHDESERLLCSDARSK